MPFHSGEMAIRLRVFLDSPVTLDSAALQSSVLLSVLSFATQRAFCGYRESNVDQREICPSSEKILSRVLPACSVLYRFKQSQ